MPFPIIAAAAALTAAAVGTAAAKKLFKDKKVEDTGLTAETEVLVCVDIMIELMTEHSDGSQIAFASRQRLEEFLTYITGKAVTNDKVQAQARWYGLDKPHQSGQCYFTGKISNDLYPVLLSPKNLH